MPGAAATLAIGPGAGGPADQSLPPLRDDLTLLPAPPGRDGEPGWTIHDPVRNRFFRIGFAAFETLARWGRGGPQAVADAVAAETVLTPTAEDVLDLHRFLASNNLLATSDAGFLMRQAAGAKPPWYMWLVHNYLFFRVPLVRPDRFLERSLWLVEPFYGRLWRRIVIAVALVGVLLASRQWDAFVNSFLDFVSWEGAALYGATIMFTKALHELGHGYTAKRHGCRVPTMGVAFLVMWPVLYTDATDAWRLVSRRARLEIASAGMAVELTLAAFATLAWSFLPDGPLRSAAFLVATVTWITTLVINLTPFLRFDGYYLLADALDMPNLQDRAFALARWRLRELLFGFGEPPPENFDPGLRRLLLVYAYGTWVYRLILFIGIALLVYHLFFKVLGILLFVVEIVWFIAKPVWSEIREWWGRRGRFRPNLNLLGTACGLAGLAWLAATPLAVTASAPAVWRAGTFATLHPPAAARVVEIPVGRGEAVEAGAVVARLEAPDLEHRWRQVTLRIDLTQATIDRLSAGGEGLDRLKVLEEDLAALIAERDGLAEARDRLDLRSPVDGVVADLEDALVPGRWVSPETPLALVVAPGSSEIVGYVAEGDLGRIRPGASARFYPDDPARTPIDATVAAVDAVNARTIDLPALAAPYGGRIAVEEAAAPGQTAGALVPYEAMYRVRLVPVSPTPAPAQTVPGLARVEAEPQSLAARFWKTALAVLIRETGF